MAIAAGSLRRKKQEAALSAKSKRDKTLLAGGSVVLIAVLAFEVPKMLNTLSGSSPAPAPAPAAATVAPATLAGGVTAAQIKHDFRQIAKLQQKNPFTEQLAPTTALPTSPLGKAPSVKRAHFTAKNPFKVQIGDVPATPAPPLAKSGPVISLDSSTPGATTKTAHKTVAASAPYGYIIILRSLGSKQEAISEVKKAHANGLTTAAYLFSSKYTTLRKGYWVVYLNKYATAGDAAAALQGARSAGYSSAYSRPVKK